MRGRCISPGCDRVINARSLCMRHYSMWRKDPASVVAGPRKRMPGGLTHGEMFALTEKTGAGDGCIEWCGTISHGYGFIQSKVYGNIRAHRVAYALATGPIPDGFHVLHSCDNPPCINPEHLFLGKDMENVADMMTKKRHAHGENCRQSKLTEAQVREIRRRYSAGGVGRPELGAEFGVSASCIQGITEGRTWKHVA